MSLSVCLYLRSHFLRGMVWPSVWRLFAVFFSPWIAFGRWIPGCWNLRKHFTHLNKRTTPGASTIWFTLVKYITRLLTQSGMIGSWSSWSSGRIGSWRMERPRGDAMYGTSFWQSQHSVALPGWSWQFWPLQEHQEHLTRMGSCCCQPGIGKNHFG